MLLVKLPEPPPSIVLVVNAMVGFCVVLQTTPLAVMLAPPSLLILPPEIAEIGVMAEAALVIRLGETTNVKFC